MLISNYRVSTRTQGLGLLLGRTSTFGYLESLVLNKRICSYSANAVQTAEATLLQWQKAHTNHAAAAGAGTTAASPRQAFLLLLPKT